MASTRNQSSKPPRKIPALIVIPTSEKVKGEGGRVYTVKKIVRAPRYV